MLLCWEIHKLLKGSTSHFGGEAFFKHFWNLCKIICASSWKHGIIIKASWSLPISSIVCVVSQMWRANTFWRDSKGSKHISLKGWNWLQKLDTYMDIVAKWIYLTKFKSSCWWIQSRYFHITSRAGSKYFLKGLLREQTYISQRLKSTPKNWIHVTAVLRNMPKNRFPQYGFHLSSMWANYFLFCKCEIVWLHFVQSPTWSREFCCL